MASPESRVRPYFPARSMRRPMVRWFSPREFLTAVFRKLSSVLIGANVDTRELQLIADLAEGEASDRSGFVRIGGRWIRDYSRRANDDGDFYFDFVADTGDGWDSTYSIASLMARDQLVARNPDDGALLTLPRGDFVVLGGDQVYPAPGDEEYRDRLVRPFACAWDWRWLSDKSSDRKRPAGAYAPPPGPPPRLYAIPGNHDWYDSLGAFRARFCNPRRRRAFGFWRTDQSRSYFALKLPQRWYLFGVDLGLFFSYDNHQFNYFAAILEALEPDARIILAASEPDWVFGGVQNPRLYQRLQNFESLLRKSARTRGREARIYLNLSGDTHNYQRYERMSRAAVEQDYAERFARGEYPSEIKTRVAEEIRDLHYPRQKIVCGGGGAFLHATHGDRRDRMILTASPETRRGRQTEENRAETYLYDLYECKRKYPDESVSRKLIFANACKAPFFNWRLSLLCGAVYAAIGFLFQPLYQILRDAPEDYNTIEKTLAALPLSATLALAGLWLLHYVHWTDGERPWLRRALGALHASLQCVVAVGGHFIAYSLVAFANFAPVDDHPLLYNSSALLMHALASGFAATTVLAGYLALNLSVNSGNYNDASALIPIDRYHCFLRLRIDRTGVLTAYPIGVARPRAYSLPEPDELSAASQKLLGAELEQTKSAFLAPDSGETLRPRAIAYHLIEAPVRIVPVTRAPRRPGGAQRGPRRAR